MTRRATLWLAAPSRYAGWSAGRARIVFAMLAFLIVAMTVQPAPSPDAPPSPVVAEGESDLALYATIVEDVRHGGDYYLATAQELRARAGYPLRPFVTFRLPTLARVQAALPDWGSRALLILLATAVAIAWLVRLRELLRERIALIAAALLLGGGMIVSLQPMLVASHEVWAALLIAASLAARRPGRWVAAVALGLAAMLVRETAALFVLLMLVLALRDGERREAAGWAGALAILAVAVAAHAAAVWRVTTPLDTPSDGWTGLNGLWFYAMTLKHATILEVFPFELAAPVIALALLGWSVPRDPLALRMAATLVGYGVLIAGFARLNNFYWGLLVAPVALVGLAFVPDGLRDLWRTALDRRRITVTRTAG